MNDDLDGRLRWLLALALGSISVGGTVDLILDRPATWLSFHVIFETLMIAGALVMATTLDAQQDDRRAWMMSAQAALEGLGRAIDAQFRSWRLTPTEGEVALLLLKGYSHKEIAALTGRSERTVRQHAGEVYEKAGLSGRAALAAFFLHGLMLPDGNRETVGVA